VLLNVYYLLYSNIRDLYQMINKKDLEKKKGYKKKERIGSFKIKKRGKKRRAQGNFFLYSFFIAPLLHLLFDLQYDVVALGRTLTIGTEFFSLENRLLCKAVHEILFTCGYYYYNFFYMRDICSIYIGSYFSKLSF
jgi:hypothetical protein